MAMKKDMQQNRKQLNNKSFSCEALFHDKEEMKIC